MQETCTRWLAQETCMSDVLSYASFYLYRLKSDTVAVLLWYPRYYRRSGSKSYGITTVLGLKRGNRMGMGPGLRYSSTAVMGLGLHRL